MVGLVVFTATVVARANTGQLRLVVVLLPAHEFEEGW